ncbi:SDR family NAD(P)-dependent oxidoreductase [Sphingobium sp. H39-3-25]|uniref:SDR family NAD(P)-dependent oxidoreductase n=1 Tax=Sphingobium arseniciresistens TaxID=3030834 RepID=UPI0023B9575B|nr:SDR family NAD(P)-dependent oxidoreductase [Sphingobium arseniciresistens]
MAEPAQRVAVVTGANSGIGKQVAKALARQGWRVIGTGRDADRIKAAEAEIRAAAPDAKIDILRADLSLLAEAEILADAIAARTDRIDLLVNNAGGMTDALVMTSEGLEANFAGNHLGPFVLTRRLLPLLRATAADAPKGSVRIINTASDASEMISGINLDDMQNLERFSPGLAYCTGKLANVLFARALAVRLADDNIVAHAVHPGAVASNFFSHAPADTQERAKGMEKASEEEGADTIIWLATAPEGGQSSGGYWHHRAPRTPNPVVEDAAVVARFWDESEKLTNR